MSQSPLSCFADADRYTRYYTRLGAPLGLSLARQFESSVPHLCAQAAPQHTTDQGFTFEHGIEPPNTLVWPRPYTAKRRYKSVARYLLEAEDDLWAVASHRRPSPKSSPSPHRHPDPGKSSDDRQDTPSDIRDTAPPIHSREMEKGSVENKPNGEHEPVMTPGVFSEEPPQLWDSRNGSADGKTGATTQSTQSSSQSSASNGKDGISGSLPNNTYDHEAAEAFRHAHHHNLEGGLVSAAAAADRFAAGKAPQSRKQEAGSVLEGMDKMADGIGGSGLGTAATGDLGARHQFETLEEIRSSVAELEGDFNAKHPETPLSGRIIHVSHYIPFVIRPLAEVDFERRREEQISAAASVAALAAAARARRAGRTVPQAQQPKSTDDSHAAPETQDGEGSGAGSAATSKKSRQGSFKASSRAAFGGGFGMTGLDGEDLDARLAENLMRSKAKAGRRAWMADESAVDDEDERDRFTPRNGPSRRASNWTMDSRASSFVSDQNPFTRKYSAVSDDNSPVYTPPPVRPPAPQWVLTPRRGHTALNSGIRSLCKTHAQTFIGWPGDLHFAAQARNDERSDPSETTESERKEIEEILASLDDSKNWTSQDAPVMGAATEPGKEDAPQPISTVPTPLMNGAEPIGPDGPKASGAQNGKTPAQTTEKGIRYVPVWLDYNVAHGHYEGYCKTSEYSADCWHE